MIIYPDQVKIEIFTASWVDISADVVGNISGSFGFSTNSPDVRVANTGFLSLTLNNINKKYSPNHPSSLSGWKKGIPVKVTVVYRSISYVMWRGRIEDINIDTGTYGERRVDITATDWMDTAARTPVPVIEFSENKKINEAVQEVINLIDNPPINTSLEEGVDTFPTVHDTLDENSLVYTELNRLTLSEFGYTYLKRDKTDGETLVVESRNSRDSRSNIAQIPENPETAGFLLLDGGDYLLLDGGDKLILSSAQDVDFDNNANDLLVKYGETLLNKVTVRCYPRRIDDSIQVLATLRSRINLPAGESQVIRLSYVDPNNLANIVNGKDMVSPVATTDYKMYQLADGTGTDLTANLTVTANYGVNFVDYTLTNTGGTDGYVTFLQARGYGIYFYEPISLEVSDQSSINSYGIKETVIDQKYQQYTDVSGPLAQVILDRYADPILLPDLLTFVANKSYEKLMTFLYLDMGDLINVKESQTGIDAYFFIHGGEFTITPGKVITASYYLTEALTVSEGYWLLETVGYGELEISTIIGI